MEKNSTESKSTKRSTQQQLQTMVEHMDRNPEMARGIPVYGSTRQSVEVQWRKLALILNSLGPPTRTAVEWKKTWADLKSRAKKKIAENHYCMTDPGGGGIDCYNNLTPLEELIDKILHLSEAVAAKGSRKRSSAQFDETSDIPEKQNKKKDEPLTDNLSTELKKDLAAQVKLHPRIWDSKHRLHYHKSALDKSWQAISNVIGCPVSDCQAAWISMKESYRHYAKLSKKVKPSRDPNAELLDDSTCSNSIDWEFADDMSFLPRLSQKKDILQTFEESVDMESSQSDTDGCVTEYNFAPPVRRQNRSLGSNSQKMPVNELLESFDVLIQSTQRIQDLKEQAEQKNSKFKQAFTTFDWLLNKLPIDTAEKACEEFTMMLMEKVNAERAKKSEID